MTMTMPAVPAYSDQSDTSLDVKTLHGLVTDWTFRSRVVCHIHDLDICDCT